MRIAHITTDEVNLALGVRLARSLGADMIPYSADLKPAEIRRDAVLCDLDRIPPDRRRSFLNEIHSRATELPLAVYGYCLSEEEADERAGPRPTKRRFQIMRNEGAGLACFGHYDRSMA